MCTSSPSTPANVHFSYLLSMPRLQGQLNIHEGSATSHSPEQVKTLQSSGSSRYSTLPTRQQQRLQICLTQGRSSHICSQKLSRMQKGWVVRKAGKEEAPLTYLLDYRHLLPFPQVVHWGKRKQNCTIEISSGAPLYLFCIAWLFSRMWFTKVHQIKSDSPSLFLFLTFLNHFFQNVHVVFLGNATQWRQLRLCYQLQQLWVKIEVTSLRAQRYLSNLNS